MDQWGSSLHENFICYTMVTPKWASQETLNPALLFSDPPIMPSPNSSDTVSTSKPCAIATMTKHRAKILYRFHWQSSPDFHLIVYIRTKEWASAKYEWTNKVRKSRTWVIIFLEANLYSHRIFNFSHFRMNKLKTVNEHFPIG